jgi:hypothetical protein
MHKIDSNMLLKYHHVVSFIYIYIISVVFCFNWLRGRGLGKSGGGRNNFVLYSPINYN